MSNFTPAWFKKGFFNESLFCDDFLSTHQLLYSNGAFFTPDDSVLSETLNVPILVPPVSFCRAVLRALLFIL